MYNVIIMMYIVRERSIDMTKKIILDAYEQDIEDNYESLQPTPNMEEEMARLMKAAKLHSKRKKSITLRVHETDLEAMRLKASRLGIAYQTYINILIHKDATQGAMPICCV